MSPNETGAESALAAGTETRVATEKGTRAGEGMVKAMAGFIVRPSCQSGGVDYAGASEIMSGKFPDSLYRFPGQAEGPLR
jgi:hypothetical protein